jgi:hypothetical protein
MEPMHSVWPVSIVGAATVTSILPLQEEISIEMRYKKYSKYKEIVAKGFADNKEIKLGYSRITYYEECDRGVVGAYNKYDLIANSFYRKDLDLEEKLSMIFVEALESSYHNQYKGVGTALMQASMEYGYGKGCAGRLGLDASWDSHGFYYKLGMRTLFPPLDKRIAQSLSKGEKTYNLGLCSMYLPQAGIEFWKSRIQHRPIFDLTKLFLTK